VEENAILGKADAIRISNRETSGMLTASVITGEDGLRELAPEWTALFDRSHCDNIYLSYEWMQECWNQREGGTELFLVAVRSESGTLVGLAPLCIAVGKRHGLKFRVLTWLTLAKACCDHLDMVVEQGLEEVAAEAVAGQIVAHGRSWNWVDLDHTAPDSPSMTALARKLSEAGLTEYGRPSSVCPYVVLADSWDEFFGGLSASMRRNLRSRWRALEGKGNVQFQCLTEPGEIEAGFEELVRLHRLRFSGGSLVSAFLREGLQKLHKHLLLPLAKRGRVRIYILQVNGASVSALYGFSTGRRIFQYQGGLDPEWLREGVGAACIAAAIEDSIARGEVEYDFLRGEEEHKSYWTKTARQDRAVMFFGSGLVGRIELYRLRLFDRIRAWRKARQKQQP
jgi:CelD/BcsL family acetyltransferase involved in cellulose biosynthesis